MARTHSAQIMSGNACMPPVLAQSAPGCPTAGHGLLPVLPVEVTDRERIQIHPVEAAHVDVNLVGVRARDVETVDSALATEVMTRGAGSEPVGGERVLAAHKLEAF